VCRLQSRMRKRTEKNRCKPVVFCKLAILLLTFSHPNSENETRDQMETLVQSLVSQQGDDLSVVEGCLREFFYYTKHVAAHLYGVVLNKGQKYTRTGDDVDVRTLRCSHYLNTNSCLFHVSFEGKRSGTDTKWTYSIDGACPKFCDGHNHELDVVEVARKTKIGSILRTWKVLVADEDVGMTRSMRSMRTLMRTSMQWRSLLQIWKTMENHLGHQYALMEQCRVDTVAT